MFNKQDEYQKATQHAQVNTYDEGKRISAKLIFLNLSLFALVGSFVFLYTQTNLLSGLDSQKTAVLGVSLTVDDSNDEEYLKVLSNAEVDSVKEASTQIPLASLNNSMKLIVSEASIQSQSSYTNAISRELDDNQENDKRDYRVVIVKKGDTLSTLSEKFYGNSMQFQKIINSNKHLTEQSYTLYVGEKINIPY